MAMATFNTQERFNFDVEPVERVVIPDAGTSLTIEFFANNNWVADPRSPVTTPVIIFTSSQIMRCTPDTGSYSIDLEGLIS